MKAEAIWMDFLLGNWPLMGVDGSPLIRGWSFISLMSDYNDERQKSMKAKHFFKSAGLVVVHLVLGAL